MTIQICVPKEVRAGEQWIALVADTVKRLAEAGVPYDKIYDMDDVNADFKNTTVALVIGTNERISTRSNKPDYS